MLLLTTVNYHPTQPAVCTRELCVFSFYTLGVMSGAAEEVATGAEVTTTQQTVFVFFLSVLINCYFLRLSIKSQNIDGKKTICVITKYFIFTCVTHYTLIMVSKKVGISVRWINKITPSSSLQVVDLLVAMCRAALESPRKSIIFEPYPSVVDPNDPKTLAFNPKVSILTEQTSYCYMFNSNTSTFSTYCCCKNI